jgi:hypothetical protein
MLASWVQIRNDYGPQEHEARKYHRRIVIMVYKKRNLAVRKKQKTRGKTEGG